MVIEAVQSIEQVVGGARDSEARVGARARFAQTVTMSREEGKHFDERAPSTKQPKAARKAPPVLDMSMDAVAPPKKPAHRGKR